MRIVIDLQGAQTQSRFRGIGRYTLSFTKALIQEGSEHEFYIVLNGLLPKAIESIRLQFAAILPESNILVWTAPGPVSTVSVRNTWRHSVAELIREAFIQNLKPDLIYISSFMEGYADNSVSSIGKFDKGTPVTLSLYDLIPLINPQQYLDPYPPFKSFYLDRVEQMRKAERLLSISEFSKHEGVKYLGVAEDLVVNVSTAVESFFSPAKNYHGRKRYFERSFGISKPYILYTGGADERKNLRQLIIAFSKLPKKLRSTHQLVFAGKLLEIEIEKLLRESKSAGVDSSEFKLTGYISDEDLIQLYSNCAVYVFPSWHEGFGLPALEAMACGAPVIGSNRSSLPEVIGNPNALFDPMSHESITTLLESVLSNPSFRDQLVANGKAQSTKFDWRVSAKVALQEFQNLREDISDTSIVDRSEIQKNLITAIVELDASKAPSALDLARLAHCMDLNSIQMKKIDGTDQYTSEI